MTSTYNDYGKQEGNKFEGFASDLTTKTIGLAITSSKLAVSLPQAKINSFLKMGVTVPKIMDHVPRPEFEAKLEAAEARMDARLITFDRDMRQVVSDFRLEIAPLKNLKTNYWSGVAIVVATIVGTVAMAFGAFDSGRETAKLTQEAAQQTKDNRKLLEEIKLQLKPTAATAPLSAASK